MYVTCWLFISCDDRINLLIYIYFASYVTIYHTNLFVLLFIFLSISLSNCLTNLSIYLPTIVYSLFVVNCSQHGYMCLDTTFRRVSNNPSPLRYNNDGRMIIVMMMVLLKAMFMELLWWWWWYYAMLMMVKMLFMMITKDYKTVSKW